MDPWYTQPIPSFESVGFVVFLLVCGFLLLIKKLVS